MIEHEENVHYNLSAEAALIGGVMYNNGWYERVEHLVRADQFYSPAHQLLWETVIQLISQSRVADGVTMVEFLEKNEILGAVGGSNYLAHVFDSASFMPELVDYARIVAELARKRELLEIGYTAAQYDGNDVDDELDRLEDRISKLRDSSTSASEVVDSAQIANEVWESDGAPMFIDTGFPSIREKVPGFERGTFTVLAGRPGMGKTAMAICIARNQQVAGETVGYFSLEMPRWDILARSATFETWYRSDCKPLPYFSEVKYKDVTIDQGESIRSSIHTDHFNRLLVDDRGGLKPSQMRRQIRSWMRYCRKRGRPAPSTVYVDHIGHMQPDVPCKGLYERTTAASNACLAIAKEFDIAVVGLAQLNREVAKDGGRRPGLHDLRDSGAIEQDAALVCFVHREDYYVEQQIKEGSADQTDLQAVQYQAEFIISKARSGRTGVVPMKHRIGHNAFFDNDYNSGRFAA